ncbi:uncharacterized protein LOC102804233 [Saccoglossus kowalevskii]|uniref:Neuropilin and tolloid-like protein 2-like n=1 Tax=Saccoglossus kowalevskii TaxID=10224 RepID=A0ABM0LZB2_SACKO|nr:PREDICTED: neuropilin and tolloid-like protein 2-like [Saccoglossus kowalevskii]
MASLSAMVYWSALRLSLLSLTLVWTHGFEFQTTYLQDSSQPYKCKHNISYTTGEVFSHQGVQEKTYQENMDCSVIIHTEIGQRINIRFDFFDLSSMYNTVSNECSSSGDRVHIYDTGDLMTIRIGVGTPQVTLCGAMGKFPDDYQSSGNVVTLRFISDKKKSADLGFKFIYTSFYTPGEPEAECFTCEDNSMCVSQDLVCNGVNNCNDDSDESDTTCNEAPPGIFALGVGVLGIGVVAIVGATIGVVFLIILIVCIVCCCRLRKSGNGSHNNNTASRPTSYPNHSNHNHNSHSHSPIPRYPNAHAPPPPPSTSPYPSLAGYPMYHNGGTHHLGSGVMYHHSHESVDLPQKL